MKSLSEYMDNLVAQDVLGPVDRMTIQDQVIDSLVWELETLPSFEGKSLFENGARDMRRAAIKHLMSLKS